MNTHSDIPRIEPIEPGEIKAIFSTARSKLSELKQHLTRRWDMLRRPPVPISGTPIPVEEALSLFEQEQRLANTSNVQKRDVSVSAITQSANPVAGEPISIEEASQILRE